MSVFSWLSGLAFTGWPDNQHAIYNRKLAAFTPTA
jgi:hypothetical protein